MVTGSVQYLDVGIKLEVEPHVYVENDVGIKLNLEVSNIVKEIQGPQGSLAYQIGTRSATTILRLRDGETQILGGLISDLDRNTASKVPGLGQLPVLGRLFSNHAGNNLKTEIVLSITPRIVRAECHCQCGNRDVYSGTEAVVRETPLRLDPVGSVSGSAAALPAVAPGAPRAAPRAQPTELIRRHHHPGPPSRPPRLPARRPAALPAACRAPVPSMRHREASRRRPPRPRRSHRRRRRPVQPSRSRTFHRRYDLEESTSRRRRRSPPHRRAAPVRLHRTRPSTAAPPRRWPPRRHLLPRRLPCRRQAPLRPPLPWPAHQPATGPSSSPGRGPTA